LAANTGCTTGTCTVKKIVICSVIALSADANVNVSKHSVRTSSPPPNPFQRAIGRMNSNPARVDHFGDLGNLGPTRLPSLWHSCNRNPAVGVEQEQAKLQPVGVMKRVGTQGHAGDL